jgi:hypothetical protein
VGVRCPSSSCPPLAAAAAPAQHLAATSRAHHPMPSPSAPHRLRKAFKAEGVAPPYEMIMSVEYMYDERTNLVVRLPVGAQTVLEARRCTNQRRPEGSPEALDMQSSIMAPQRGKLEVFRCASSVLRAEPDFHRPTFDCCIGQPRLSRSVMAR